MFPDTSREGLSRAANDESLKDKNNRRAAVLHQREELGCASVFSLLLSTSRHPCSLHCRGKPTNSFMTVTVQSLPSGGKIHTVSQIGYKYFKNFKNGLKCLRKKKKTKKKNPTIITRCEQQVNTELDDVVLLVFFALVVEDRRGDTSWQHSHQDREPKPVCASVHQSPRGDRDPK